MGLVLQVEKIVLRSLAKQFGEMSGKAIWAAGFGLLWDSAVQSGHGISLYKFASILKALHLNVGKVRLHCCNTSLKVVFLGLKVGLELWMELGIRAVDSQPAGRSSVKFAKRDSW